MFLSLYIYISTPYELLMTIVYVDMLCLHHFAFRRRGSIDITYFKLN